MRMSQDGSGGGTYESPGVNAGKRIKSDIAKERRKKVHSHYGVGPVEWYAGSRKQTDWERDYQAEKRGKKFSPTTRGAAGYGMYKQYRKNAEYEINTKEQARQKAARQKAAQRRTNKKGR